MAVRHRRLVQAVAVEPRHLFSQLRRFLKTCSEFSECLLPFQPALETYTRFRARVMPSISPAPFVLEGS
jgi:hypothetical protein